jgi:hypothetical protein
MELQESLNRTLYKQVAPLGLPCVLHNDLHEPLHGGLHDVLHSYLHGFCIIFYMRSCPFKRATAGT